MLAGAAIGAFREHCVVSSQSHREFEVRISVFLTHPYVASWNVSASQLSRLQDRLPNVEITTAESEDAFLQSLPNAEVAIVWSFRESWLRRAPRLEWLVTPAAGREFLQIGTTAGLDVDFASFHGVIIGETVLGMLLGHYRGLFLAERLRSENLWPRWEVAASVGLLRGSKMSVLGFGAIGRWIGRFAKPFGVRITGFSRGDHLPPEYFDADDRVCKARDIDEHLPQTDILVVALPSSPSTDKIIDARRIALLKSDAVLVNVGRGNAIDEFALAEALSARRLGGAYLDVYEEEPLPELSPLRKTPNTFLFPHASALAPKFLDFFFDEFAQKFAARYEGRASIR